MPTYIDGVGTSEAIDTAGEVVSLKGIDISSLVGSQFNFEHKNDVPAQIVGKILEATKIFSKEDCKNDRHAYYWNKVQIPFLYVMGRLFDDRKPSAVEVAALFHDDAEHPNEQPMIGFSVEGARLGEKNGMVVPRSIARKITITAIPANKTCVAEVMPEKKVDDKSPNSLDSLFKGELEIFKYEASYADILEKKENLKKASPPPVSTPAPPPPPVTAQGIQNGFNGALGLGKKELKKDVGSGGGAFIRSQLAMSEKKEIKKAMSAGSGMAAPSELVDGAALTPESLERKLKRMYKKEKSHWYEQAETAYNTWDKKNHFKDYMKKRMPHLAEGEVDAIGKCLALKKARQAEGKLSKMYSSYFYKAETGHEKGIIAQATAGKPGESVAGWRHREKGPGISPKAVHEHTLNQMKQMPKPNLPKSENLEKGSDIMMASETHIHGLPKGHPALGEHKGHTYRRTSPPVAGANHWSWAVRNPAGKDSQVHLPAHTAGSKESIHSHIDSLIPKK